MTKRPVFRPSPARLKAEAALAKFINESDPVWEWIIRKGARSVRQFYLALSDPMTYVTPETMFALFEGERVRFPTWKELNDAWYRSALCLVGRYGLTIKDLALAFRMGKRGYDQASLEERWKAQAARKVERGAAPHAEGQRVGDELMRHFRAARVASERKRLIVRLVSRLG
jgi:hypothetical protein